MVIIHFIAESDDQPCCQRPEREEWLWSADPSAVTCPGCVAEQGRLALTPPPQAGERPRDGGLHGHAA